MYQFKHVALVLAITLLVTTGVATSAEEKTSHKDHNTGGGAILLSADLQHLLAEEMGKVQSGMSQLSSAIAAGQWDKIIEIAKKIEGSYIIKQKLTAEQKEELAHKLPKGFKKLDGDFHETAGWLAHAAEMKNKQLVPFFYYKLTESCITCHSAYATKRFPNLAEKKGAGHEH